MSQARTAPRKGKSQAPRKKPPRRTFRWKSLVWRLALVGLLLLVAWMIYLDIEVTSTFEDHRWEVPSRVYARPLELYSGAPVDIKAVEEELRELGYLPVSATPRSAGYFSRSGSTLVVHTRGFRFPDGDEPGRLLELGFSNGNLERFRVLENEEEPIARLEPQQIAGIYPGHNQDRVLVRLDDVPPLLRETLIRVEDRNFEDHFGLAPVSIMRAFVANLRAGRVVQGGSTLTQQLVKNFYLTDARTYQRKFNEALMALLLELRYSKDDILESYINEVYLGQAGPRAIHGFGLGSRFYFGKELQELELHEIALLVAMVRGPSYYNPRRFPERARDRRNLVIDVLESQRVIDARTADKARSQPLEVVAPPREAVNRYPGFMDLVRHHLERDYSDEDLESAGLRIFTTLDPRVQESAERQMSNMLVAIEQDEAPGALEGAALITRRESGEIQALVAGRDPRYSGFNRAMQARRPIGSLVKPAVYLAALEQPDRYTLASRLQDEPFEIEFENGDLWAPRNFDGEAHGEVPLHRALSQSYNLATVRLGLDIGLESVLDSLERLGLRYQPPLYPSLLLGSIDMTPLEVAELYQTIAAGGFQVPLRSIRAVTTSEGEVLSRYDLDLRRQVDAGPMHLLHYGLQEAMREGTGRSVYNLIPGHLHTAGKTGTTNEGRDSWFAGFTGSHLGVFWVGGDDYRATHLTGSTGALQIWGRTMGELPQSSFTPVIPDGIRYDWIDEETGAITEDECRGARQMPFIEGSQPRERVACEDTVGGRIQRWFQRNF